MLPSAGFTFGATPYKAGGAAAGGASVGNQAPSSLSANLLNAILASPDVDLNFSKKSAEVRLNEIKVQVTPQQAPGAGPSPRACLFV